MTQEVTAVALAEKLMAHTTRAVQIVTMDQLQMQRHEQKYALLVKQLTKQGTDATKMEVGELIMAYTELSRMMHNSMSTHAAAVTQANDDNMRVVAALRAAHEQSKE